MVDFIPLNGLFIRNKYENRVSEYYHPPMTIGDVTMTHMTS